MLLRPARPEDADAVARVHVRSWQVGYRGLIADACLDAMRPEDRARRYTFGSPDPQQPFTILAEEDGRVLGFATTMPARDPACAGEGELAGMYVDPAAWGRGIGRALLAAARARLAEHGFASAILWVLVGNTRAQRFYESDGWRPDGSRRTEEVWGATVEDLRYRRPLP